METQESQENQNLNEQQLSDTQVEAESKGKISSNSGGTTVARMGPIRNPGSSGNRGIVVEGDDLDKTAVE